MKFITEFSAENPSLMEGTIAKEKIRRSQSVKKQTNPLEVIKREKRARAKDGAKEGDSIR